MYPVTSRDRTPRSAARAAARSAALGDLPDPGRGQVTGIEPAGVPGEDGDLLVARWHRHDQLDREPVEPASGSG
jgi:hypothetical protein